MLYTTEPDDFKPIFEVVSCFCEYEGKILLLLRQDGVREPNTWGMVAGKVDAGETKEMAIKRELVEETGIEMPKENFEFLKKTYVKFPSYDFVYYIFRVKLTLPKKIVLVPREHKDFRWLTPGEALKLNDQMEDLDNCIKLCYSKT